MNKYSYLHVVQGYYGDAYGWEDITESESYHESRRTLREYRENAPEYTYRLIKRRELTNQECGQ